MPQIELEQLFLKPRHLAMLQEILQEYLQQAEVWAYGSRVTGGAHDGSDLDLVVRNLNDLNTPTEAFSELQTALADSNLPMLIDLHDWALLPAEFQQNIQRAYVVVA